MRALLASKLAIIKGISSYDSGSFPVLFGLLVLVGRGEGNLDTVIGDYYTIENHVVLQ